MSASSSAASIPEAVPRAAAVVVAAGAGRRMGGGVAKQYLELCGEPVLLHAIRPFLGHAAISRVVVVLPAADARCPPDWLHDTAAILTAGGPERGDSVWNGLLAVPEDVDLVLIHDGARPFVTVEIIDRVLAAASSGAAVAGVPAADTLKVVGPDDRVRKTLDRSGVWHAQTPQGFRRDVIVRAYTEARNLGITATDDAALCERLGVPALMVQGSPENIKITRPGDLAVAEALSLLQT